MKSIEADFVVIGSGAGGSTVFQHLAMQGRDVLVVEEGLPVPSRMFESMSPSQVLRDLYRYGGAQPVVGPASFSFGEGRILGGTTELNGGLFWRTPPKILKSWRELGHFQDFTDSDLDLIFSWLENELGVTEVPVSLFQDRASEILQEGAEISGRLAVPVPRAGGHLCKRSNRCAVGCPIGAKQSMSVTLIPTGQHHGGRVLTDHRVVKLVPNGDRIGHAVIKNASTGSLSRLRANRFFLSGGPVQSPVLLGSALTRTRFPVAFHLNAKVLAKFDAKVEPRKATIFTRQVQDFMDQGVVYMASALNASFLALELADFDTEEGEALASDDSHLGLYTAQIAPRGLGSLWSGYGTELLTYRLSKFDNEKVAFAVTALVEDLFAGGARQVWLPLRGRPSAPTVIRARQILERAAPSDWLLSSVHAMASLAASSNERSLFRLDTRSRRFQNLWTADSASLPSAVGESPQATIMAFTKANLIRNFGAVG